MVIANGRGEVDLSGGPARCDAIVQLGGAKHIVNARHRAVAACPSSASGVESVNRDEASLEDELAEPSTIIVLPFRLHVAKARASYTTDPRIRVNSDHHQVRIIGANRRGEVE